MHFDIHPIGVVHSSRANPVDDGWDAVEAHIMLDEGVPTETLLGLDSFSHALVVYIMHEFEDGQICIDARHPRGREDWPKVGIFAQRNSGRPNRIGVSVCRIAEIKDRRITLEGLDAIDGTPVVDIKPWVVEFGPRGEMYQPQWMTELMKNYW